MQFFVLVHLVARGVFGETTGTAALRVAHSFSHALRALPAWRAVIGAERGGGVEARGAVAAIAGEPAEAALRLGNVDIALWQFIEKARRNIGLPQPVHAAVGGEINLRPLACAR